MVLAGHLLGHERRRGVRAARPTAATAARRARPGRRRRTPCPKRRTGAVRGGAASRHPPSARQRKSGCSASSTTRTDRAGLIERAVVGALAHARRACRSRPTSPRPSTAPSTRAPRDLVGPRRAASTTTPSSASRSTRRAPGSPSFVASRGHAVERGVAGHADGASAPARAAGARASPILAEYDALPGVGHACGHNLIAAARGRRLRRGRGRRRGRSGGEVVLLGTPAEEGGGGKITMIEAGIFDGVDAAMMFHPFDRDLLAHPTLASLWLTFDFEGAPSHAAIAPHAGRSALTACLDTFRLIDGQRVHFRDGVRVHGYVTERRPGREHHPRARRLRVQRARARRRRARARPRHRRAVRARRRDGERRRGRDSPCARATATWSTTWPSRAASASTSRALGRSPARARPARRRRQHRHGRRLPRRARHPPVAGHRRRGRGALPRAPLRRGRRAREAAARTALVAAKVLARTAVEFLADAELRAARQRRVGGIRSRTVTSIRRRAGVVHRSAAPAPCRRPPRAAARSSRRRARSRRRVPVDDDARDLGPPPPLRARDAEGEQVARLDPVVGHDDAAHVRAQDRRRARSRAAMTARTLDRQRAAAVALDDPDEELRARSGRVVRVRRRARRARRPPAR